VVSNSALKENVHFNVGSVSRYVVNWKKITSDHRILDMVEGYGYVEFETDSNSHVIVDIQ